MTMEYIYFVLSIAAVGFIVNFSFKKIVLGRKSRVSGISKRQNTGLIEEPIPPRKRTISGPSIAELDQIEFQSRIGDWQKSHATPGFLFTRSEESLNGKKYTYDSPHKSRVAATGG